MTRDGIGLELELDVIHYHDCIEGLKEIPNKSIDLICTDPPYGLDYNNRDLASHREAIFEPKSRKRMARMAPNPIKNDDEKTADKTFKKFLNEAKRILKNGACCCCCCCGGGGPKPLFAKWTLWMDDIIGFKQAIVWNKGGLGMGMHYRRNYEFILIAQNGSPCHRWNGGKNTPNIWEIPKIIPTEYQHPTIKPVELMEKIINIHSNPGDIVLDPFMGHGTTAVACKRLDRHYIGFEINKEYKPIIEKCLANIPSKKLEEYDVQ